MPGNLAEKRIEADDPAEALAMRAEELRLLEAMLFASNEPLDEATLKKKLPDGSTSRRRSSSCSRTMPRAASISCASTASGRSARRPTCRG